MRRALTVLTLLLTLTLPALTMAQGAPRPVLRIELEKGSAIPGQPIVLRITVLVPTWLPKPPALPGSVSGRVRRRLFG